MIKLQNILFSALLVLLTACGTAKGLTQQEQVIINTRAENSQDKTVQEIYRIKKSVESEYGVKLWFNKLCKTYWGRYRLTANNDDLLQYFRMMESEIKKYPADYFIKSRAKNICFGEHLSVNRVVVAAMPAPEENTLLYSVSRDIKPNGRKPYKIGYLTNTFHHELFHNTDYVIWGKHYYKWSKWHDLNVKGFSYAGKGTMAYTQKEKMRKMKLLQGFMNKYSQTGMEEDRAEIMEAIMLYPQRKLLIRKCKQDEIIRNKVNLLVSILDEKIIKHRQWHIHEAAAECNQNKGI